MKTVTPSPAAPLQPNGDLATIAVYQKRTMQCAVGAARLARFKFQQQGWLAPRLISPIAPAQPGWETHAALGSAGTAWNHLCHFWLNRTVVLRAERALMANALRANALREWLAGRQIGCRALLCAAFATLVVTVSLAQDAGVSGIPLGPANINGQNNTGRDPSGIGNASKVAPLPEPSIHAATPPTAAPLVSTQAGRVGVARPRFSHLSPRARRIAERAAVKEYDRLLRHGAVSICRGC